MGHETFKMFTFSLPGWLLRLRPRRDGSLYHLYNQISDIIVLRIIFLISSVLYLSDDNNASFVFVVCYYNCCLFGLFGWIVVLEWFRIGTGLFCS